MINVSDRNALILFACALTVVVAALTGAVAGYLARRDNASYPVALTRAAITFAATLTMACALTTTLAELNH